MIQRWLFVSLCVVLVIVGLPAGVPTVDAQGGTCDTAASGGLNINDQVYVSRMIQQLRVRAEPSITAEMVGTVPQGRLLVIRGGPVCQDGYRWWQVIDPQSNAPDHAGWVAESWGDTLYLVDHHDAVDLRPADFADLLVLNTGVPNLEAACPGDPDPSYLRVGVTAYSADDAHPFRVRTEPTTGSEYVAAIHRMTVTGGPVCSDGLRWWQLSFDDGTSGWTVENAHGRYWLIDPGNPPPQVTTYDYAAQLAVEFPPAGRYHVRYTPAGDLLVGTPDGIRRYDGATYTLQDTLAAGWVIDFTAATQAVTWEADQALAVWDLEAGAVQYRLDDTGLAVPPAWAVYEHPDVLFVGASGGDGRLWARSAPTNEAYYTSAYRFHFHTIEDYQLGSWEMIRGDFKASGMMRAAVMGGDMLWGFSDTIWVYRANSFGVGFTLRSTLPASGSTICAAITANGTVGAMSSDRIMEVWQLGPNDYNGVIVNLPDRITDLAFSPDGSRLAVATDSGVQIFAPFERLPRLTLDVG
jgi:hypothetical protein